MKWQSLEWRIWRALHGLLIQLWRGKPPDPGRSPEAEQISTFKGMVLSNKPTLKGRELANKINYG
jgi:hypothetical protein